MTLDIVRSDFFEFEFEFEVAFEFEFTYTWKQGLNVSAFLYVAAKRSIHFFKSKIKL